MKKDIEIIWIDLHEELLRFIQGKVKDASLANDLLQEVFLKVQLKMDQLKDTAKLTSWVYQITRNTIIDYYRNFKINDLSIDNVDLQEDETADIDYSKLSDCINQKIHLLKDQYKEAILLTAFKNYSQKDLATHLQISYSGAKSRIQRAREILKEDILHCPNVIADEKGNFLDYQKNNT